MIRVTRSAVIDAPIERVWAVLRDFNSHTAWHPVVAESEIEGGEPSDQIGCVRRFTLRDGNRIREQLLALSDRDHVSTYCLTFEEGTLLWRRRAEGKVPELDPDLQWDQLDAACAELEAAGYARYEVSNWARRGFESRHNHAYWRCRP